MNFFCFYFSLFEFDLQHFPLAFPGFSVLLITHLSVSCCYSESCWLHSLWPVIKARVKRSIILGFISCMTCLTVLIQYFFCFSAAEEWQQEFNNTCEFEQHYSLLSILQKVSTSQLTLPHPASLQNTPTIRMSSLVPIYSFNSFSIQHFYLVRLN